MKRSTVAKTFTMAAVIALALGMSATAKADDKGCSNATLRGTYAYTSTGSITTPPDLAGPIAEVGTQTFDGKGATTASATLSSNGTILQLAITGTYTVNPDCTATATINVYQSGTLVRITTLNVVYVNNVQDAHAIFTSLVLQPSGTALPTVITVDLKRLFPRHGD